MLLFPPLALAVQAGAIPETYEVSIIDENIAPISFDADLVGITANTYSIRRAYEISQAFRDKGIPVVLGGNHPSILPNEAAAYADSVVIGDGEKVWPELLKDFEKGELKKFYRPERYYFDLKLLPRRDLFSKHYRFNSLETVRGCPFDCDFCSVTRFHGALCRSKALETVEQELEKLQGKALFLVDDNFIGPGSPAKHDAQEILTLFRRYNIRWMGQASIDIADNPDLLRMARDSGCIFLFIGFESLNPEVLRSLNKRLNYQRGVSFYKEVIRRIHEHGISVMGSFIIGNDFDSSDSIRMLKDFVIESQIDIPNITHLTPYPGTRVYEKLKAERRLFDEQFWLQKPFPLFTFRPTRMTLAELEDATLDLVDSFSGLYASTRSFFNTLKHTRSIRTASYSVATSNLSSRIMKQQLQSCHIFQTETVSP